MYHDELSHQIFEQAGHESRPTRDPPTAQYITSPALPSSWRFARLRGMAHTFEELKHKTVAELRDIAKDVEHEAVKGYTQLNKEHLLPALCKALGIDTHGHHQVFGIDKSALKAKIKALKKERDAAIAAHDAMKLKSVRRQVHRITRDIRRHSA